MVAANAAPASTQVAGSIAVQSDYRVRGYSISGNKPAAILDLSYDDPSGFYLDGAAIGAIDHRSDPVLLGAIGSIGYARRIGPGISVDAGYARTQYFREIGAAGDYAHYDEIYAGLSAHGLSGHVYVSPDHFRRDVSTLYGEIDGVVRPASAWRLTGHVGLLAYLSHPGGLPFRNQYDWQIGLARPIGHVDLHVALTGGGPGGDYYRPHDTAAVVGGVSWFF
jgi:uncharacterized protein (TIGR02001 family)